MFKVWARHLFQDIHIVVVETASYSDAYDHMSRINKFADWYASIHDVETGSVTIEGLDPGAPTKVVSA